MPIHTAGEWFCDDQGRKLLLRGVNISGSSKIPTQPDGATHLRDGLFDHRSVSFVGRPFPLDEADEHFRRLQRWGFTVLRFLITWEAIEHAGPGLYDEEYLDYLRAILCKAGEYGFQIIIDPHQDVWSRFTGGDGAPGWTLEAAGFEMAHFHDAGAAILHQLYGDPFPTMVWPTNGVRLAAATMFTLFFGGNDFAPATLVDGQPIQEYLQQHYIAAYRRVAEKVADLPHVIGYEVMNEPMPGFIGCKDLTRPLIPIKFGPLFSPLQSMLLGSGFPQEIEIWERHLLGTHLLERQWVNPKRLKIWREGYDGVWCQNGVWGVDEKERVKVLKPRHFWKVNGHEVNFSADYMRPFINRFAEGIRQVQPDALIFIETDPLEPPPQWSETDAQRIAYAPHWYDSTVLFLKTFSPWVGINIFSRRVVLGRVAVRRSFAWQMTHYKELAAKRLGGAPTLIGETGIAYDLENKRAYHSSSKKAFQLQEKAMDRTLKAMEDALMSYTLWNYTAENDNRHGDQWNGEDLSIFSRDQQTDPANLDSGGRALAAVIRPYARATAGVPLKMSFDYQKRVFTYEFRHDPSSTQPTELFIPAFHYPAGYTIWVTDGELEVHFDQQTLCYSPDPARKVHQIRITPPLEFDAQ